MKKSTSIMSCIALFAALTLCACSTDKENSGTSSDNSSESSQVSQSSDVSSDSEPDDASSSDIQSDDTSSLPDADSEEIIERLLSEGWLGITATGITESSPVWTISRTSDENITTTYELLFTTDAAETDGGSVTLSVSSADNNSTFNGQWQIVCENERPSVITLTVTDADGNVISDSFDTMVALSGEELVMFNGEGGELLPFMTDSDPYSVLLLKTE